MNTELVVDYDDPILGKNTSLRHQDILRDTARNGQVTFDVRKISLVSLMHPKETRVSFEQYRRRLEGNFGSRLLDLYFLNSLCASGLTPPWWGTSKRISRICFWGTVCKIDGLGICVPSLSRGEDPVLPILWYEDFQAKMITPDVYAAVY